MFLRREEWVEMECQVCLELFEPDQLYFESRCRHVTCKDCMKEYIKSQITEAHVNATCIGCDRALELHRIRDLLQNDEVFKQYKGMVLQKTLLKDPNIRWCPAPDCGFAVIVPSGLNCPKLQCGRPGCGIYFCYKCRCPWHENMTCDGRSEAHAEAKILEVAKPCPTCNTFIQKVDDGACNHMTCTQCDTQFCWGCMTTNAGNYSFQFTRNRVRISKCKLIVLICCLLLAPIIAVRNTIHTSLTKTARLIRRLRGHSGYKSNSLLAWEQVPFLLSSAFSPVLFLGFVAVSYFTEVISTFSKFLRRLIRVIHKPRGLWDPPLIVYYNNGYTEIGTENEDEVSSGDHMVGDGMSSGQRPSFTISVSSL